MFYNEYIRILVVEDVSVIARSLKGILTSEGFQVEIADNGEDALAKVGEFHPHLMLLDLLMPKMNGMEALKRIRELPGGEDIGVIISSTKDFRTEWSQAEELGAFGKINKPVNRVELLAEVRRFVEGRAPSQSEEAETPPVPEVTFHPALETSRGRIQMWGTRGSIPVSGTAYHRHGGNTTCMEFCLDDGDDVLIFDAGSGIRELGVKLAENPGRPIHLFVTHTHWDHIQGFPFFAPLFQSGAKITIYGDVGFGDDLASVLQGQFARDYFPVQWDDCQAEVEFKYLRDEPVEIGEAVISRQYVNHPGATVGYKINYRNRTTVFIPDNEFLQGYLGSPDRKEDYQDLLVTHFRITEFAEGADVLIHEAQYFNQEYETRVGWGHTSLSNACILASISGVKEWIITHHDPSHDDETLGRKLALTQQLLDSLGCSVKISHAHDGLIKWL